MRKATTNFGTVEAEGMETRAFRRSPWLVGAQQSKECAEIAHGRELSMTFKTCIKLAYKYASMLYSLLPLLPSPLPCLTPLDASTPFLVKILPLWPLCHIHFITLSY